MSIEPYSDAVARYARGLADVADRDKAAAMFAELVEDLLRREPGDGYGCAVMALHYGGGSVHVSRARDPASRRRGPPDTVVVVPEQSVGDFGLLLAAYEYVWRNEGPAAEMGGLGLDLSLAIMLRAPMAPRPGRSML